MKKRPPVDTNDRAEALISAMDRVCARATKEKCRHEIAGARNEKISAIYSTIAFMLTLLTSSALFASLFHFPDAAKLAGAVFGLTAAVCTAIQALRKYPENASRHMEISICFDVVASSCSTDSDRFKGGQIGIKEFDIRLRTYNDALNLIIARATHLSVLEKDWANCPRTGDLKLDAAAI